MEKVNKRIEALGAVYDKVGNPHYTLAVLKKPRAAFGGQTLAEKILDNDFTGLYTFLDSPDFD